MVLEYEGSSRIKKDLQSHAVPKRKKEMVIIAMWCYRLTSYIVLPLVSFCLLLVYYIAFLEEEENWWQEYYGFYYVTLMNPIIPKIAVYWPATTAISQRLVDLDWIKHQIFKGFLAINFIGGIGFWIPAPFVFPFAGFAIGLCAFTYDVLLTKKINWKWKCMKNVCGQLERLATTALLVLIALYVWISACAMFMVFVTGLFYFKSTFYGFENRQCHSALIVDFNDWKAWILFVHLIFF